MSNYTLTFEEVATEVRKFGRNQGAGDSALANAFIECVRGAAKGALDTVKRDKAGSESKKKGAQDHADLLYLEYVTAYGEKDTHKASTVIKGASYFRQGIKMGALPGTDAIAVINRAQVIYKELKAAQAKVGKPIEAYVAVARAQLESPTELTPDEIKSVMVKEPKETSASTLVKNAEKLLEKAYDMQPDPRVEAAVQAARDCLAFLLQQEKIAELQAARDEAERELAYLRAAE